MSLLKSRIDLLSLTLLDVFLSYRPTLSHKDLSLAIIRSKRCFYAKDLRKMVEETSHKPSLILRKEPQFKSMMTFGSASS